HPELLIADEPTTALDVTVQAQILDLVRELRREMGMSIVWITHDLAVIAGLADRVLILYAGQIVESGTVRQIFRQPRHPYTRALLRTLPSTGTAARDRLDSIPGQPPLLREAPRSCPFAPRCAHAHDRCHRSNPPLMQADDGQFVACWLVGEAVSAHA